MGGQTHTVEETSLKEEDKADCREKWKSQHRDREREEGIKSSFLEHPGGSVVECLPLAYVMIPGSWDQVPHWGPRREPASPSACVSISLCLS